MKSIVKEVMNSITLIVFFTSVYFLPIHLSWKVLVLSWIVLYSLNKIKYYD
jgi:hypothetical protein